jgi:autotransporter-associated beta strand protein
MKRTSSESPTRTRLWPRLGFALAGLCLLSTYSSYADLVGPYSPDANTLYLFHFNEAAGSAISPNAGTKGGNVITVTNDTSFNGLAGNLQQVTTLLGYSSYTGFGNAFCATNTDGSNGAAAYDGNADGEYTSDQDGVPSADQIALTNLNFGTGAGNSPWTIEALIRPSNITLNQEIVCTDGHNVRGFQFRLSGGQLEFNQIGVAGANPKFPIPTTGTHAFVADTWYHVALTYDGATLRMFWTKLDPSVGAANQIGSHAWVSPASIGALLVPLVIGDENRGGFGEPFRGLIDEVRISSSARAANGMQFFSPAVTISQSPVSQSIDVGQPVTFEVLASSTSALGYQWRFNGTPITGAASVNTFSIASVQLTNAGNYDVIITNQTGSSATSQVAVLTVGAGNFLKHRWSFTTDTTDSVGGATGTNQGTATVSGGALVLDGAAGSYMELPPFLLSGLTAVTFDFWASFGANTDNCRVFDFGNTNFVSAFIPPPQNYVFFSPRAGGGTRNIGITGGSSESQQTLAGAGILDSQTAHVTVVVDPPNHFMAIYTNGVLQISSTNLNVSMASLNDELCWIGRSLFIADPYLNGSINELRIYRGALSAASIQQSDLLGPDNLLSNGPVDILVNPANASVAVGQTASFSVGATGQTPIRYQWYRNGGLIADATNANYSLVTVIGDNNATFQCFATNTVGATTYFDASTVATLTVFTPPTLAWLGAASSDWNTSSLNWTNVAGGAVTTFSSLASALFDSRGSAAPFVNLTEVVNPSTLTANATTDYTLSGSGALTGQGRIVKQNSGTLIIDVTNDMTGGTLISAGTLQIGQGGATGTTGSGAITNNAALVVNRNDTLSVPNVISGSGSLTQAGSGTVALSGNNTYSGATLINSGTVLFQSSNALGSAVSGTTVASAAQLYVTANVNTGEGLTLNGSGPDGSGALRKGGAGFSAVLGAVSLGADTTIGLDGGATLALSNVVSGTAALTLTGGGTISLNANNTYTAGTVLSAAIVNVNANRALGPGPVTIPGTGRLVIGDGVMVTNSITADSVSPGVAMGLLMANDNTNNAVSTLSGPITLNVPAANGGHFVGPTSSGYLNVAGPVAMPSVGNGFILLVRLGNVRFSGATSGYDTLEVRAGTTSIGAHNAIATTAALDLAGNGSPTVPTYFDLNGFNQTLGGLKNTVGPANLGVVTNSSATSRTLTLDLQGGFQSFSGHLAGNLGLTLVSGTQAITGTNAYTGNTTVNGGVLQLAVPSLAAGSTVTVANGALLQLDFTGTNQVSALVLGGVSQPAGVYNSTTSPSFLAGTGSLRVQSIATNPTNITAVASGNQYDLSWPASHTGWRLQAQTNSLSVGLSGTWFNVAGSTTTNHVIIPINPANGSVFFRLVYP